MTLYSSTNKGTLGGSDNWDIGAWVWIVQRWQKGDYSVWLMDWITLIGIGELNCRGIEVIHLVDKGGYSCGIYGVFTYGEYMD